MAGVRAHRLARGKNLIADPRRLGQPEDEQAPRAGLAPELERPPEGGGDPMGDGQAQADAGHWE